MSTPKSALKETPPCITVTLAELARALDQMGTTEPVSAMTRLYHTLQLQSAPLTGQTATAGPNDPGSPIQSGEIKPNSDVLSHKEIRHRMLEMAKASFPDGIPSPYIIDTSPSSSLITLTSIQQVNMWHVGVGMVQFQSSRD